ncbi:MAG: AAA family ATPase [Propionivibrio sp.]|nr:AAA family ATPase [Propionivibrio sp.]
MPEPTEPVDPLAAAQAAVLSGLAKAKVHPIRQGIEERAAVKCVTAEFFLNDIEEPRWLVSGIVQRGYLYALTAPTNHGKTAVSLVMAMCVASGQPFAGCEVEQGNVLILCGENQDGFRLRMLATMESLGIVPADIVGRCWVYPQSGPLEGDSAWAEGRCARHGRAVVRAGRYVGGLFLRAGRER